MVSPRGRGAVPDIAALDEMASRIAAAVGGGGQIWVLAEAGLEAAARAVVVLFQVGRRPLPARPVSEELPATARAGDALLAFGQGEGSATFDRCLQQARERGLTLALVPPELTLEFWKHRLLDQSGKHRPTPAARRRPSRASKIAACLELAGDLEELTQRRLPIAG